MSLESCIRKAGKALTPGDAAAIRVIRDDIVKVGRVDPDTNANQQAVDEYLDILEGEREFIMNQVEGAGGFLADPNLSASEFAQTAAANLDEAARKFPQKGIERPVTETIVIDAKTGDRMQDSMDNPMGRKNRQVAMINMQAGKMAADPHQRVLDLVTERTHRTVEQLYPDFYTLPPDQVLAIVAQFDVEAAIGLAKHFDILPRSSRKLIRSKYDVAAMRRITDAITSKGVMGPEGQIITPRDDTNDWFYGWAGEVIANWITKNETLPLYYKVDDVMERDFVEVNPESPLAVTTKHGQILQEAEEAKPMSIRKAMDWVVDKADMTKEMFLGGVPQTKLKDFMRYGLDHVGEYTNIVKKMDAWMNKVMEVDHQLAAQWRDFNQSEDGKKAVKGITGKRLLSEFMHASSLAGVDAPAFMMPDEATFKKMNKEDRAMWLERAKDHKKLMPFWDKLGRLGGDATYQQEVYNPITDRMENAGPPTGVSEAQHVYLKVRDTYNNQRTMLMYNLEKRIMETEADNASKATLIATLRKQFEAGQINPYFPLERFGKYQAVAKDRKTGEVIGHTAHESRRERTRWMDEMRSKKFIVIPFDKQATDIEQMNKIDPGFVASVTGLLSDSMIVDIEGNEISGGKISDEIWQMYLRTLPEMSARKQYIHRIGTGGFTHDALRAFAQHSFHGTHQTAKLRFGHEMNTLLEIVQTDAVVLSQRAEKMKNMIDGWRPEGMEDATMHELLTNRIPEYPVLYAMEKKKRAPTLQGVHEESHQIVMAKLLKEAEHDGPWAVPLANEMVRRHNYNMNPKSAPWSTKLTALGFFWFLSTSPAAGVLNMTQTAISAYPTLRAAFNGQGAGIELWKASGEYATAPTVEKMIQKLRGNKDEQNALIHFQESGMYAKTRTRELQGLSEGGDTYSIRQERALHITGWIFHKTEEFNRVVTSLAAYRLARKKGLSHSDAIIKADDLVEISHYDYTNTNRPRFMQGDKGRVVFLFRNYSLNMTYRLVRDFKDGIWKNKNIPLAQRKEARQRFLGIIGMTTIFAGVGGYPLFSGVEMIANNLLGDDDDPYDLKTGMRTLVFDATREHIGEVWGQKVATAVMKGPWSAFTGADLSTRASLNNLWMREIPEQLKDDPQAMMLHLAGEALGPIFGMGLNFAGGFRDIQQDRGDRAIEKFMPKFAADALKTLRFATQGAQTYQRDMIVSPEEMTNVDLFLQMQGFTPTRLSDRYEQNRSIKDLEQKLRNRRSDLMNQLFMSWRVGDRSEARDVMQDILAWNRSNPGYPITPDGIRQSARTRAMYDMRTVGGVAVDKRLQYLQETQRFTARPQ